MFFILGGVSGCHYVCTPPYIPMPPVHLYAPRGVHTPPYVPHTPQCICMFSEASACCGGCKGPPYMLDTSLTPSPCMRVPPLQFTPQLICWLPCASVCFRDICMPYGDFSLMLEFGDVPPSVGGSGGESAHGMSICSFLHIFVVHYVLHL